MSWFTGLFTTRCFYFLLTGLMMFSLPIWAQRNAGTNLVEQLLRESGDSLFQRILESPAKYRVQILYTQVNRDRRNRPGFTSFSYRLDPAEYFYPASTVKLPGALAALEKVNQIQVPGLTRDTPLCIDSAYTGQTPVLTDPTSISNLPSVGHYIRKILLTSDNDAYNRLYEFVGQETMNEALHRKGYPDVRLLHRLSVGDGGERARYTNPISFYREKKVIYQQPLVYNPKTFSPPYGPQKMGRGFIQNDKLVPEPMDFSEKNYISVADLQKILQTVMFPEAFPRKQRFDLTPEDHAFLYRYLSMLPRESDFPKYDPVQFYDSYAKFLLFGNTKGPLPGHIRIFNKIGVAYGFMIDNAYVVDFKNGVEFFLTAVILGNADGIFNDDQYEYDTVNYPFMAKLGQMIYKYELNRKRVYQPNLKKFNLVY